MTEELDALKANDVREIVVPPGNAHFLHNIWVYKTNTDANGDIERFKSRLVIRGNEQVFGVDYTLKFAAVMDLGTVKLIQVLSRRWKVPARHGDVPNAYVKAEKKEHLDIYMKVSKGMTVKEKEMKDLNAKNPNDLALLLKKSLYGLKQAGQLWSKLLDFKLRQSGYQQCTTDMCLNFKYKGKTCTVVGVYVDDLLVTGPEQSAVDDFFKDMASLSIKDLWIVDKFLGLRIELDNSNGYALDQEPTIDLLLRDFGMESCNGVGTPIGDECNVEDDEDAEYLPARGAKGDPVRKTTRQTHKPTLKDWKTAKRITRYLKMSKNLKLHLDGAGHVSEDVQVECWSEADFATSKANRKSISGCVLTVDGAVVLWLCKKQSGVSPSTMEAEFISASQAGRELLGMKELMSELKLRVRAPMPMWIDNQAAIKQLKSEKSTSSASTWTYVTNLYAIPHRKGLWCQGLCDLRIC
uniref:Reverse transcriptase Ty1/copia-type domain-containing protein n=1 Tax=Peronospora matthiolae TaxID=2874970 RepID=A0AAV1T2U8_9STRA